MPRRAGMVIALVVAGAAFVAVRMPRSARGDDWPCWRGPRRDGISRAGRVQWEKTGLGKGTVLIADGHLIVLGDHGQLVLARATPEKDSEISRCQVFDRDTLTWTAPVLSGGRLFVRSQYGLLALDVCAQDRPGINPGAKKQSPPRGAQDTNPRPLSSSPLQGAFPLKPGIYPGASAPRSPAGRG